MQLIQSKAKEKTEEKNEHFTYDNGLQCCTLKNVTYHKSIYMKREFKSTREHLNLEYQYHKKKLSEARRGSAKIKP